MTEAVWHHDEHLSYEALQQQAGAMADGLARQGNGPVLVYGHKSPSMAVSICACLLSGRTYVPVDTCIPAWRIRKIHQLANARLIMTCEALPEGLEDLEQVSPENLSRYKDRPLQPFVPGAPAYILFTSGSSGEPKGVAVPRESLASFLEWFNGLFPGPDSIRVLNQASLGFDLSVADFFYALSNGHSWCVLDREDQQDGQELVRHIQTYDPHLMVATPTFIRLCLLDPDFCREQLPALRAVFLCGEMLDGRTVKRLHGRFPGLRVINAYGPTEACCAVCGMEITAEVCQEAFLPVGRVQNAAADITIENGEIVLRGPSVALGYVNGEAGGFFQDNGVRGFRTGDLGEIRDGLLYCLGRRDRQVKYKGFRIGLDEIEQVLLGLDGVRGCVVQALKNRAGAVASVEAVVETNWTLEQVQTELAKRLPPYMMPRQIRVCDRLSVNGSGKADRKGVWSNGCLSDAV